MYGAVYNLATSAPTSAQWTSIGIVATIIMGIVGLYYQAGQKATAKSDAASKARAEIAKPFEETIAQMRLDYAAAIKQLRDDHAASKEELRRNMAAQITQRDDVIDTRNQTIRDLNEAAREREKRIDTLEDQLRDRRV